MRSGRGRKRLSGWARILSTGKPQTITVRDRATSTPVEAALHPDGYNEARFDAPLMKSAVIIIEPGSPFFSVPPVEGALRAVKTARGGAMTASRRVLSPGWAPRCPRRPPSPLRPVAVLDMGASAIRLVVAEMKPGEPMRILEEASRGVLLGKDTFTSGRLGAATVEATLKALEGFRRIMDAYGVVRYRAVATSAVREAGNRDTFLDRVRLRTGIDVEVIDGSEENRLTYLAVREDAARPPGPHRRRHPARGGGRRQRRHLLPAQGRAHLLGHLCPGLDPHAPEPGGLARQPRGADPSLPPAHPQRGRGHPAGDAASRGAALHRPRRRRALRGRQHPGKAVPTGDPGSSHATPSWHFATRSWPTTASS